MGSSAKVQGLVAETGSGVSGALDGAFNGAFSRESGRHALAVWVRHRRWARWCEGAPQSQQALAPPVLHAPTTPAGDSCNVRAHATRRAQAGCAPHGSPHARRCPEASFPQWPRLENPHCPHSPRSAPS